MIELNSDSLHLTMQGNGKVTTISHIEIIGTNTLLKVEHTADFSKIPTEHHEMYLRMLQSTTTDKSIYGNTPAEPYPMTIEEKQRDWKLSRIISNYFNRIK
tara:strand:+ start:173 stop:475 length:303 start_codon:yes stop_codon:yes gene_type:complete